MKLVNISRATAENFPWNVDNRDWLISIHSSQNKPAKIIAPFGAIHNFCFDDVEDNNHGVCISQQQATQIADIIKQAENARVNTLWVHCDAGICRSGAVVEAAKLLGHTPDDEISNDRIPNTLVFTLVRIALGIKHSWE
jgi:predicted protein tyrosine phosphatase